MKHDKISIKWKIFFFLLIFTAILLVVLWLIQICYLDTFYKMIKTGEAVEVTSEAIAILQSQDDDIEEQLDDLAAGNNMAILITDTDAELIYNAEYIANSRMNTLPKEEILQYYEQAKANGGSAKVEFEGSVNKTFEPVMPQYHEEEPMVPFMQNQRTVLQL